MKKKMLKSIKPIKIEQEKFDPDKLYYLIGTAYGRNNEHYLIFLSEDGEEKRYRESEVYPYFYVRSPTSSTYIMTQIEEAGLGKYLVDVEPVELKNPMTDENEILFKVRVKSPNNISSRWKPEQMITSLFDPDDLFNNKVKYYHVVLNEKGYIMGMPYKFPKGKPEMVTQVPEDIAVEYNEKVFSQIDDPEALKRAKQDMFMMHSPLPDLSKMIKVLDIEIKANMGESMDAELAEVPITSMSITFKEDDVVQTDVFVLDNDALENEPSDKDFEDGTYRRHVYSTEKVLLKNAIRYINALPQKLIVTYNGDAFDIPYIARRLELHNLTEYGIEGYKLSDKGWYSRWYKKWKGHYLIDLYEYFGNNNIKTGAYISEYENLKLDTVAETILKANKYKYEGRIEELSSEELAFYNAKDTQLTFDLATHDDNFPAFILFFIMRFGNLSLENANRKGVTAWWSGYEFRHLHQAGYFYPTDDMLTKTRDRLKGGMVLDAIPGLHKGVDVYDFSSLYPTMVIFHNICYSTMNCSHAECQQNIFEVQGVDYNVCTKRTGFIPSALSFLRNARVEIYKPKSENSRYYAQLSQFIKIFMNACFGAMANPGFAFMSMPAAMTITQTGRDALKTLQVLIEEENGEVIYGDSVLGTEAVLVKFGVDEPPLLMSIEEVWKISEEKGYVVQQRGDGKETIVAYGLHVWDGEDWNKVHKIIRHYTLKTIYRVSTGIGTVDVTEDHSLVSSDGTEFKPADIQKGKDPVSSVYPIENTRLVDEDDIASTLLLFLFSMAGTASGTYTGYPSQRTVAIHMHKRIREEGMKIFERVKHVPDVFGANYKVYETAKEKILIKFSSHSQLWAYLRRNMYIDEDKVKPIPTVFNLPDEELQLVYDFLKAYYYNPKGKTDRWTIRSNSEMVLFTSLSHHFGDKIIVLPQPKGKVYQIYKTDYRDRKSTVSITRILPEHVYDFETEDGTFMAGNVLCKNTDSVFVIGANEGADKRISEKMGVDVENEGHSKLLLQHKKKNYIKIMEDKNIVKGMVGKKKNVPKFIRNIFTKAVDGLHGEMDEKEMLEHFYKVLIEGLRSMNMRDFSMEEMSRLQTLNKDIHEEIMDYEGELKPCDCGHCYVTNIPVVAAAKHLMKALEQSGKDKQFVRSFGRKGIIIEYVKADGEWRHVATVHKAQLDLEYYKEKLFKVFDQLFLPFGYTTEQYVDNKKQAGLGEYFG